MTLAARLIRRITRRAPDFIIGGRERPYLLRWWLLPRNPIFNVYLHCFRRSDDDRALHDHPWLFNCSILLDGQYREHTPAGQFERRAGDWKFRWGGAPHRVELLTIADFVESQPENTQPIPCWTLFITGPRVREWGFYCPQGFVHWKKFTSPGAEGEIGRGCDQ